MHAALAEGVKTFFGNTGPTGQRVMKAVEVKLRSAAFAGVDATVAARSEAYGQSLVEHVLAWSQGDGGAVIENMGFPMAFEVSKEPGHWGYVGDLNGLDMVLTEALGRVSSF